MNLAEKLRGWRPAPLPKGREYEDPGAVVLRRSVGATGRPPVNTDGSTAGDLPVAPTNIICPRCSNHVALDPLTCERCGFPFICDTAPVDMARVNRRTTSWRTVLAVGAILFWLTNAIFVASGSEAYEGNTTAVVAGLTAATDSGIPISGPAPFVTRTRLALDLMRTRAPDFYYRMQQSVTSIDYLSEALLDPHSGKRIRLEGIGALSTPHTGQVQVLLNTAFPSGIDMLTDGDVFNYAGVLIHELRHIELHRSGDAPGGWEEEVRCEEAAYGGLKQMQAPGAILARYQMYLDNPHAKRYQSWYQWYEQF